MLSMCFVHLHTVRYVARTDPFVSFFLDPSVLWAPTVCTFSKSLNDHALCHMLNHWNTLLQLLHCLLLSSCQLFHLLHSCFYCNLNWVTWSGIICDFQMSLRDSSTQLSTALRDTLPTINRKHFFISFALSPFASQKNAKQNAALHYDTPQARSSFWLLKPASEHIHACLLPRLSWSWTVLLPSAAHRKPIASITAVLLPFVTYLLTLPRLFLWRIDLLPSGNSVNNDCVWAMAR
jgi:hypothetical protein